MIKTAITDTATLGVLRRALDGVSLNLERAGRCSMALELLGDWRLAALVTDDAYAVAEARRRYDVASEAAPLDPEMVPMPVRVMTPEMQEAVDYVNEQETRWSRTTADVEAMLAELDAYMAEVVR